MKKSKIMPFLVLGVFLVLGAFLVMGQNSGESEVVEKKTTEKVAGVCDGSGSCGGNCDGSTCAGNCKAEDGSCGCSKKAKGECTGGCGAETCSGGCDGTCGAKKGTQSCGCGAN